MSYVIKGRSVALGSLRFLLALSVLWAHAGLYRKSFLFVDAGVAVECFFIISGFLITMVLKEKYNYNGGYKLFLKNRILRIYPLYGVWIIAFCIFSIIPGFSFLLPGYMDFSSLSFFSKVYVVISNLLIVGLDLYFFLKLDIQTGGLQFTHHFLDYKPVIADLFMINPVSWSLSPELYFYLTAFITTKNLKRIVFIIGGAVLGKIILYNVGLNYDPWKDRFFFPVEIGFFMLGSLMYFIYNNYKKYLQFNQRACGFMQLFVMVATIFYPVVFKCYEYHWLYYIFVAISIPFLFIYTNSHRYDRILANLSYPVYISHFFILSIVKHFLGQSLWMAILTISFTIVISKILVEYIEKPLIKYKTLIKE